MLGNRNSLCFVYTLIRLDFFFHCFGVKYLIEVRVTALNFCKNLLARYQPSQEHNCYHGRMSGTELVEHTPVIPTFLLGVAEPTLQSQRSTLGALQGSSGHIPARKEAELLPEAGVSSRHSTVQGKEL